MTRARRLGIALTLVACLCAAAPAPACGPYPLTAWFFLTQSPNVPLDRYLAGQIGIFDPDLARAYKYVAYRYISGPGLDAGSQNVMRDYWDHISQGLRNPWPAAEVQQWKDARQRVSALPQALKIYPIREETRIVDGTTQWTWYLNCLSDAFVTAARTLDERIAQFGAGSEIVHAWVSAQDIVFSNCARGEAIPDALPDDQPPLARADRAYQIAAAHFYAGHLEDAEREFRQIAHDPESPWHIVSAYLVARAIVRQGTLAEPVNRERLAAAVAYLNELLADPSFAAIHPAAQELRDIARTNLDPAARESDLATHLLRPSLEPTAALTLADYLWVAKRFPLADSSDDLATWMTGQQAYEHWSRSRSLTLLAAAIAAIPGTGGGAADLIEAAAQVPHDSPVYLTVAYHRARLFAMRGQLDAARQQLDELLREHGNELSLGDHNRILGLRAPLAMTLGEFLQAAQQVPVAVAYDDDRPPALGMEQKPELTDRALLIPAAARLLSSSFTPPMMLEILRSDVLTPYLQRRVALAAWTAAVLAGDAGAADLLPYVRTLAPELHTDLDAYQAARAGPARQFAAVLMFLRFPGLQPEFGDPVGREQPIERIDTFRDNWWCAAGASDGEPATPVFVSAEQQFAAASMHARIGALGPAPIYLGNIVLGWARSHPHDPRLPEALHLVVRATRYGCANDDGATSRAAFQLLHRRYGGSEWAAQTPFWFR